MLWRRLLGAAIALGIIAAIVMLITGVGAFAGLEERAMGWRAAAPLTLATCSSLMIAAWIVCMLPSTPIELMAAYIFGFGSAVAITYAGKVIGCLASFAIARSCGRRLCANKLSKVKLLRAMEGALSREPVRLCFLARASFIPIMLKNYGFGVLGTPWYAFVPPLLLVEIYTCVELVTLASAARGIRGIGDGSSAVWRTVSLCVAGGLMLLLGVYGAAATRREMRRIEAVPAGDEDYARPESSEGCSTETPSRPLFPRSRA
jgi:uncharacterized membrane protein YdjX (TVP38/TMEM64 family)